RAGRRLRRGAAQPAPRGRRPGRPPAPLRRRGGGARPRRRGRQVGDRPGPLHRPPRGGDAARRGALRRADPAGLPRQAARLARLGDPARPRRRPPGDRLRRDPLALAGGGLPPVGLLFAIATLLALAAGRELLVARATRRGASYPAMGRISRTAAEGVAADGDPG